MYEQTLGNILNSHTMVKFAQPERGTAVPPRWKSRRQIVLMSGTDGTTTGGRTPRRGRAVFGLDGDSNLKSRS
jgi:hypothetical protein